MLGLGALSLQPIDEPACRVTQLSCIIGGNLPQVYSSSNPKMLTLFHENVIPTLQIYTQKRLGTIETRFFTGEMF